MQNAINIAVIDSGITANYLCHSILIGEIISLHLIAQPDSQLGEMEICRNCKPKYAKAPSHGTLVVNTIHKYAKGIPMLLHIYDVFDKNGESSGVLLVEALKMILEHDIDIVVMSLTCSQQYREDFVCLSGKLKEKNIIMICSSSNDGGSQCPANLNFVYGVSGDRINKCGKYRYDTEKEFQFWSDIQGEFVGESGKYSFFCGTSKATAVIAGRLASYLYENGRDKLAELLAFSHDELADISTEEMDDTINRPLLLEYCEAFGLPENICREHMDTLIPWNRDNIRTFAKFMKQIGLEEEILEMNYSEFATLRRIIKSCERRINHASMDER